jgi:hypothetical protein
MIYTNVATLTKNKYFMRKITNSRAEFSPMLRRFWGKACVTAALGSGIATAANAQCTVPTITSATTAAATCPGNGTINIDATGGPSINYSILSGPTAVSGSNSSGDFISMAAGEYVVRVYNPEGDGCYVDTTVVIANAYTPFSFSAEATGVCTGGLGATIEVDITPGSSTSYEVAYWQGAPGAPDESLTYTSSTTYAVPTTAFGTWNIRVKDGCGEAITQQINVASLYPENLDLVAAKHSETPSQCVADDPLIQLSLDLRSGSTKIGADLLPPAGIDIDLYEVPTGSCTPANGTFLNTQNVNTSTGLFIEVPRETRLSIVMRTPCGQTDTICYNGPAQQDINTTASVSHAACESTTYPNGELVLNSFPGTFMIPPVFHELLDGSDNVIDTLSTSIRAGYFHIEYGGTYRVRVTDACGNVRYSPSVTAPAVGAPLAISGLSTTLEGCTNEEGKVTARVTFDGHFPGMALSGVTASIISGEDAGVVAVRSSVRSFNFFNVTPGATNVIRVINPVCGDTALVTLNVPNIAPLTQTISLTSATLCDPSGLGKGTLSYNAIYNGAGAGSVKVYKAGNPTPVFTGNAGSIVLPGEFEPGVYYAEFEIAGTVIDGTVCPNYTLTSANTEIYGSGSLPSITRKIPMVCENPVGSPTEAKLDLKINGSGPFRIEYKESTEATYIEWASASTGEEMITGLVPGITYNIKVTDICGGITNDFATMGTLGDVTFENTLQPCLDEPFTISAPRYANATYSWTKDGAALSASTNQIVIPVFGESNTGTYTCEIIIDNCLIRTAVITLYSQLCDSAVGSLTISGNVFNDGNGLSDNMVNGTPTNAGGGLFATLLNSDNEVILSVPVGADGTYEFNSLLAGEYSVVLTDNKVPGGTNITSSTLPANWVNTGDNIGLPTTPGAGATVDGISEPIILTTANVSNVNFGINSRPESYDKTQNVTLTESLSGSDLEDTENTEVTWSQNPIVITSLPTNGFELIYNGNTVNLGDTIEDYNPSLMSVMPTSATPIGTDETSFQYATVDSANTIDLSPATYHIVFDAALPVTLIDFKANKQNTSVLLTWATTKEFNNKGFDIMRSLDGNQWIKIGFVASAAADGNSSAKLNYRHIDQSPLNGLNQYRLHQMDIDGRVTVSNIEVVDFSKESKISMQPNPAKQSVTIQGLSGNEQVRIIDATGRIVKELEATSSMVRINLEGLAEGIYQVNVYQNNLVINSDKLVIVK